MTHHTPHRLTDRISPEREAAYAVLDACPVATLTAVADGKPWALPMLVSRRGDEVLIHGSTGAGLLRHVATGVDVVLTAFTLDGLVFAPTWIDHSMNYRSVCVWGSFATVSEDDKVEAMRFIMDNAMPGRSAETQGPTPAHIAKTTVLAMPIEDGAFLTKTRSGGTGSDPVHGAWTGTIARRDVWGDVHSEAAPGTPEPACFAELPRS